MEGTNKTKEAAIWNITVTNYDGTLTDLEYKRIRFFSYKIINQLIKKLAFNNDRMSHVHIKEKQ